MATTVQQVPLTALPSVRGQFAAIGVLQFGHPALRREARQVDLPRECSLAAEILGRLLDTMEAARQLHDFTRGIGLAAPQIGHSVRIAVAHPHGEGPIPMVNPVVVEETAETAVDYEGCLSFFELRGEVPRPLAVTIEYCDVHGSAHRRSLKGDAARLVLHEIDHLDGRLYIDRMPRDATLIEADDTLP